MPVFNRLASLRRNLFARPRVERDLDDELSAYVAQVADEHRAAGMPPADALRAARLEFGGVEQIKEEVRQVRAGNLLQELFTDLRYGARTLRKNPAFAIVAILALALGIGANTAMFSVAYGILWRPLPYPGADRVAVVCMRYFPRDFAFGTLCMRDFLTWRDENHSFESPSIFQTRRVDIGDKRTAPEQVQGASVTAGLFSALAVRPLLGRTFAAGDDQPTAPSLAVIGESTWRRRFSASPGVLGQTMLVNGTPATVIGVMPASFAFPTRQTEIWTNLLLKPPTRYGPWFYRGLARLKPGVTMEQAQAETNRIALRMMQQNPDYKRLSLPVIELRTAMLGPGLKPAILVLAGAVGLVLLIAIVNVANLMLARATVRRREMALRLSLGARRGRLVRQLLTESVLLALLGGAAGLALAWAGVNVIRLSNALEISLIDAVKLDGRAMAFMFCISAVTGVLFGLAPALESARTGLLATIKEGGRGGGNARARTRSVLVVAEIALSLMLLVGAGLLLRSFANLQRVNGGFAAPPSQVLTMLISPSNGKYREAPTGLAFYDEVLRRVRQVPGVQSAALADSLPPDHQGDADTFGIEGQTLAPGDMNPIVTDVTTGPGLFQSLGIPLLKGRDFDPHDNQDSAPVAIVSQGFVNRFLAGRQVLGQRIRQSGPELGNKWMEIVGVVGNVKYLGLDTDTDPAYYLPFAQTYGQRMFLVVRTEADSAHLAETLRRNIQSIDPEVTLAQTATMQQIMNLSVSQPRFNTVLLGVFAGIALLLAGVGIYGLIAYSVAQRTQEIGVRMALGAAQADVVRMVLRQGATLASIGIAIGLGGAFALTRLLKSMLFGIGATDAVTFTGAAVGIIAIVLLAALFPARRAARISPLIALRYE